jgi:hypothetical protein
MTWVWLDLVDGAFRVWPKTPDRPTPRALRVDGRLATGGSPATWVSWCRFDGDESLAFDDGAVSQALRRRLATPSWPVAVSTALVDWSRIAGAITVSEDRYGAQADPFAAVFPRRIVRVAAGTFGPIPAPTGPGITRYGSGNPWPWSEYAGQVS